jgi:hypothetical protein
MSTNLPMHVALVSEISQGTLSFSDLTQVSAAISKQVARDFSPIWGVNATVDPFAKLKDVPPGYWPVIVKENIGEPSAAGFHTDKNGNPFALVQYSASWSLTVSHETLEMLADPFGNRVVASVSPLDGKSRVEILVEVCDPSEDDSFSYTINGITVSDFYTPHYFDPIASAGVSYSFTNAIKKPRQVLKGGYLSYHDLTSDHWMQIQMFGAKQTVQDLGVMGTKGGHSIREQIDALTRVPVLEKGLPKTSKTVTSSARLCKALDASSTSKAEVWTKQIKEILSK